MLALSLAFSSLGLWIIIAVLPWRPWSTREQLDADSSDADLSDITVLIPARNEASVIKTTLESLRTQANDLNVIVINDGSTDETEALAQNSSLKNLHIISIIDNNQSAHGWSGKLWALEQGRKIVKTPLVLLLDADIALKPGTLVTLKNKMEEDDLAMLSLMARLRMDSFWEKLLMPAFIFFFKLLYPFHLSNSEKTPIAAAAGGCILLKTSALEKIGGFTAIKDALIDDCSLANIIKKEGYKIWTGLTHSAVSLRPYESLESIWLMVTRTAFTQLHYSISLLVLCFLLMSLAFILPVLDLFSGDWTICTLSILSLLLQCLLFFPTLRYYGINPVWSLALPLAGLLYLIMTCDSARKHVFGHGSEWKGRQYKKTG